MSNNIRIFENKPVEVFEFDGKALFNPYDVGKCLKLTDSAVRMAIKEMNNKQVIKLTNSEVNSIDIRKLNNRGENFLTESGVYKLIFKSRKEEAEKFQDWVTDEVLPSIRKHGTYATDELLNNPDLFISVLQDLKKEREEKAKLEGENKIQKQIIGELQPKANYTDVILNNKGLVTITQIAKDYGKSGTEMNNMLHDLGVQYKQSGQWLLYSKYHDKGYTHSNTVDITRSDGSKDVKMNTKWTQKGRLFIYNLLKDNEIYPLIEK